RWHPRGLARGNDTNTEFFALKGLRLDGRVVEEAPPADPEVADLQARATPCPRCGKARRALRVRKEGPNKGRLFLACSGRACDSLEGADGPPAGAPADTGAAVLRELRDR